MGLLIVGLASLVLLAVYLWWNRSALLVAGALQAFRKGDESGALAAFAKAEAAGRLDASTTASYAYLALKNGRVDEAEVLVNRALTRGRRGKAMKPADKNLIETYRALVLWKRGLVDDAVDLLEGLLATGYRTANLYGNLGFFLQEQGNLVRATEVCSEAADWDPDGKVILDNLASLHLRKEEWDEAAAVYERLLALGPRFPEAWHGAGLAAFKTGDAAAARQRWQKALELPFNALSTVERTQVEAALASLDDESD
jgi:tetratricopeptide (TPR) repeat protein